MALRIENVFGGNALFWVRMQVAYDLSIAKKSFAKRIWKYFENLLAGGIIFCVKFYKKSSS